MGLIREKLPNLRTAMQHLHDGLVLHSYRSDFQINTNFFFRTVYGVAGFEKVLAYLEGDAGLCTLQSIMNCSLKPVDFEGKDTTLLGCNPVMMIAEVMHLDYNDLMQFLNAMDHAAKGEMSALIDYIYPHGYNFKKGVVLAYLKYPSIYIYNTRNLAAQLHSILNYVEYLKVVEP